MKATAEQVASGPGWFVLHISTPNVHRPYLLYIDNGKGEYHSSGRHSRLDAAIKEGEEYTIMDFGTDAYCTCDKHDYSPSTCPYQEDVNDSIVECTCCPYCRNKCLMDI